MSSVAREWTAQEYIDLGFFDDRSAKYVSVPIAVAAQVLGYEQTTVRAHVRQGKLAEIVIDCDGHKVKGIQLASIRQAIGARTSKIENLKEPLRDIVWHTGGSVVEYGEVMGSVGLSSNNPWDRRLIGAALDGLSKESFEQEKFLISAVVVHKANRRPGEGFFKLARASGLGRNQDDEALWQTQMRLIKRWFDPHAR